MAELTLSREEYSYAPAQRPSLSDWAEVVKEEEAKNVSLLGPITLGVLTLLVGVGGFILWAISTELSSASVASGKVVVESNTKTVTHLEGGTLQAVLVHEGERVKEGDVLATLDVTRSRSTVVQLSQQLFAAQAQLARLVAERDESKEYTFDTPPPDGMDRDAAENVRATEKRLFRERTNLLRDQIAADRAGMAQNDSQRISLEARLKALREQAAVIGREYETYSKLMTRKLITAAMLNDKKLQLVDFEARIAEANASIAETDQRKTQLELAMTGRRNEYFRSVSVEMQQTQSSIASFRQQIVAAKDVVSKSDIRAPQDGIVSNIKVRTPGSALISGTPILDIVPDNQPMLIQGSARSQDIDQIRLGQRAEIKLSAFGAQELRPLIGHVIYIAPDSTTDERTGEALFAFKAKIDEAELKSQPNLFLYPGMSAEVYIVNGDRSALAYLAEPIKRSFYRAFREQ